MLKLIYLTITIILFSFFSSQSYAACEYTVTPLNKVGITTGKLNIRSAPCLNGTQVFGQTKTGVEFKLIGEANDYYQIQIDGQKRFIWKNEVQIINQTNFSSHQKFLIKKIIEKLNSMNTFNKNIIRNKLITAQKSLDKNLDNYKIISEIIEKTKPKEITFEKTSQSTDPSKFDDEVTIIGKYWLSLYNDYRTELGLDPYEYDVRLQRSAINWSKTSAEKWGKYTHKRDVGDPYYDFWKIQSWFKNNGVHCKVENGTAAVENIGGGRYTCDYKDGECKEKLKKTVKKTFDFYMKEKGKANSPHYDSIVSPYLNYIGFGIHKEHLGGNTYKIYNTTHLCTNFVQ